MSAYDVAATSGYAASVEKAKSDAKTYETYVRTDLVNADQEAENKAEIRRQEKLAATNLFDAESDNKKTLEQQLKALEEEKAIRINREVEFAQKEGKSQEEIDAIRNNIEAEYSDRISHLKFSISEAGATAILKHKTLAENEKLYAQARYENINTSNAVWSGFLTATSKWLDVGRMQRNLGMMQAYMESGKGFDRLG